MSQTTTTASPSWTLLLEGDRTVRTWLEAGLRARGHEVLACGSSADAWEAFLHRHPPLLVLDWVEVGGPELCRRVRATADGGRYVVLAAGMSDRPQALELALESGADDVLPKLADAGTLAARLAVAERRVRRAEEQARAERDLWRLRRAVDMVPVGVTVTDLQGTILHANPAEAEMHGYHVDELLGKDVCVLAREQPADGAASLASTPRGGRWQRDRVQRRKDGSELVVRLLSEVACDTEGEPLGFVTVCLDLGAPAAAQPEAVGIGDELRRPE
jgi:PAS domain S-box-containing protein